MDQLTRRRAMSVMHPATQNTSATSPTPRAAVQAQVVAAQRRFRTTLLEQDSCTAAPPSPCTFALTADERGELTMERSRALAARNTRRAANGADHDFRSA